MEAAGEQNPSLGSEGFWMGDYEGGGGRVAALSAG